MKKKLKSLIAFVNEIICANFVIISIKCFYFIECLNVGFSVSIEIIIFEPFWSILQKEKEIVFEDICFKCWFFTDSSKMEIQNQYNGVAFKSYLKVFQFCSRKSQAFSCLYDDIHPQFTLIIYKSFATFLWLR